MRFLSCFRRGVPKLVAIGVFVVDISAASCMAQVSVPAAKIDAATPAPGVQSTVPANAPPGPQLAGGDGSIRLGSGDLVTVSVYDVPELNTKTRVSDSGEIYLPLIDNVHVDGLTVADAERAIEKRLDQGGFVRNPHVQLFVEEFTSDGASLLGEVNRPGVYPVLGEQSLFNLISAAGGLSDRAGKSITVTHREHADKPVSVLISRNLEDHPESNVPVYPGDTIMVRRADVVYVVGEVGRPSGFLMDTNHLTVLQAIALAGGIGPNAKLNGTRILRKGPEGVTEVPVPLKQLLQAKSTDVPLQAEDILFVPSSAKKVLSSRGMEAVLQMATAASLVAIRP